jgi:hypothetical protein
MDFYVNLTHTQYKVLEEAIRALVETTHTSVAGYYHKSICLPVGDATFEFHGPAVKAAEPEGPKAWLDRRKGLANRRNNLLNQSGYTRRDWPYRGRRKKDIDPQRRRKKDIDPQRRC